MNHIQKIRDSNIDEQSKEEIIKKLKTFDVPKSHQSIVYTKLSEGKYRREVINH